MSTTNAQYVPAHQLKVGDTIIFQGNKHETVRKLIKQRDHKILVKTAEHPDGILANTNQSIAIVPR